MDTVFDIEPLVAAAIAAGREIMAVYEDGPIVAERKDDGSPVTIADRRAEAVILAALAVAAPGVPVVAEEESAAGRTPATGRRFLLVDPLDGTREFLARNGEFTVNIALVEDRVPVAGIVHAPALGQIFAGSAAGAWRGEVVGGRVTDRRPIAVRKAPARVTAIGSRSHGNPQAARWLARFDVAAFVGRGSSLKFCLLAAGEADVYPRFGRTMEWDTAAGDAVLRSAGGIVTTLDGAPLLYDKRNQAADADFANPFFVAYGDPALARNNLPAETGEA